MHDNLDSSWGISSSLGQILVKGNISYRIMKIHCLHDPDGFFSPLNMTNLLQFKMIRSYSMDSHICSSFFLYNLKLGQSLGPVKDNFFCFKDALQDWTWL